MSSFGGVALPIGLGNHAAPRIAVHGDDGPALSILASEMNQKRVPVVLNAQAVGRAALLMKDARRASLTISNERGPPRSP